MRARALVSVLSIVVTSSLAASAAGVPDHKDRAASTVVRTNPAQVMRETHPDPRLAAGGVPRPGVEDNFQLLDHVRMPGRQPAADVYFFDHGTKGKFVYIGTFRAPCTSDGVTIVDVSTPDQASVAAVAPLPFEWRTSTEDVVVEAVGDRVILAGGLQACRGKGKNGVALWDVTRPSRPVLLRLVRMPGAVHELDLAVRPDGTVLALAALPFVEFENTYFGTDHGGEFRIVDITDPLDPQRLSDWGIIRDTDLVTFGGDEIVSSFQGMDTFFAAIYAHSVRDADQGMTAYVSYWDAGVIKLDISDPTQPTFVARTFFEVGDAGDAHSMFPLDVDGTRYLIENDEDYSPDSPVTATSSETGSTEFNAMHEPWMPQDLYDTGPVTGDVVDGGDGCEAADYTGAEGGVALVDTVDPFYVGIIEGWTAPCRLGRQVRLAAEAGAVALLSNLVGPDDPYPFPFRPPEEITPDEDMVVVQVADADGLADALRAATGTATVTFEPNTPAVGYVRIFDESQLTDLDGDGQAQEFTEIATFTEPPNVFGEPAPPPKGTWSVHNTEVNGTIAYSSWYSHGIIAWDLSTIRDPVQVGQFRPPTKEGWPQVWGVAFDPATGIVYASDLVGGLWIADPTGPAEAAPSG
jgi:hypothetical protein